MKNKERYVAVLAAGWEQIQIVVCIRTKYLCVIMCSSLFTSYYHSVKIHLI